MASAIEQAIAAANAAKEATAAAHAGTAVATAQQAGTAVNTYSQPAQKLSMETVSAGSMNVDLWIKPKEFGLTLGDIDALFKTPMVCSLEMTDGSGFIVKKGIKAGNPAQYWYTVDGVTCTSGGSWEAAIMKAKGMDNKAYEYRTCDLPFTLLEDVVVDGKTIAKAGQTLGNTLSTTNWKNWAEFHKKTAEAGLIGEKVVLKIGHEKRENANNNKWGVLTFELVGSFADAMATAGE